MNQFEVIEKYGNGFGLIDDPITNQLPHDCFAFPGLINAHDHLDFSLFPPLANRVYSDYIEWGEDIHLNNKEIIQQILQIPLEQRILFGVLKNLVNGITRVVHHGEHHDKIRALTNYPVWMNYQYIHALRTDKRWKAKLNLPIGKELMIHIGEGTSPGANSEIDHLLKWNLLHRKLTGIHAISITAEQARSFKAIVWCPASNLFLYDKTMRVEEVKDCTTVLFGTDSSVSAPANLWEQLRAARALQKISDEDLFRMLTHVASNHFYKNQLQQDWVVAKSRATPDWNTFYNLNPQDIMMVVINRKVWLCDDSLAQSLRPQNSMPIHVGDSVKWVERHLGEVVNFLDKQNILLPLGIKSTQ